MSNTIHPEGTTKIKDPAGIYKSIRKWLWVFAAAALAFILSEAAYGESNFQRGKRSWLGSKYQSAYEQLMIHRKTPYGRTPEVDYMLGTSGCRISGKQTWGADVLDWMLYAYPLTNESRNTVRYERDICRTSEAEMLTASVRPGEVEDVISAGMSARGKTFYWVNRDIPVNSYPAKRIAKVDPNELKARLYPLGSKKIAQSGIKALVPEFRVAAYERFIVASTSNHSDTQMENIATALESFIAFLAKQYRFSLPDTYITIYMVTTVEQLRELGRRIHGLDISPATIGYAFREDLSIVGVIPSNTIGTLMHELFHLSVRRDFGDIPQWLDEGMASLYEVSKQNGKDFRGVPNWRGKVLQELWAQKPTLEELIYSEWFPFDLPDEYRDQTADRISVKRHAAEMATARYFVLYMQEKNILDGVFIGLRDVGIENLHGDVRKNSLQLVEEKLGSPIGSVEKDFEQWFHQVQQ